MRKITTKSFLMPFMILFIGILFLITFSCSSDEKEDVLNLDFQISEASDITENSAVINASLISSGKESILFRGICVGLENNPTTSNMKYEEQGNVLGLYTGKFEDLQFNTKYYARAYVTTNSKTIYGGEISFTTKSINLPTLAVTTISSITQNSAKLNSKIENDGASKIISKGFFYSKTNPLPDVKDLKIESTENFEFSSSVAELEQNTKYYVRAYASNLAGTAYGQVASFITSSYVLATVTTGQISTIAETTAIGGGTVVNEGSHSVTERGICWATNPNPTIANSKTKDGNGIGSFVSNLYSLQPYKLYYVRSYATSKAGTAYGEGVTFNTIGGDKPTVVASARTSNTTLYATVTVKSKGSDNIKSISIGCFDLEGNSVGKVSSSSSWNNLDTSPSVNYEITGLSRNNRYYIIGYAANGVGKAASEKVYFSTL